jgi:hypothetical protein
MEIKCVIVESPYAGDVERNVAYARAAVRDCLMRGEAPFASHLLYTQPGILDDNNPAERLKGIHAGLVIGQLCHKTVVYQDLGITQGMQMGIEAAYKAGREVEYRSLVADSSEER